MGALKLLYSHNIDEQSESRFAYMTVVYKNPTPSEAHGDYQLPTTKLPRRRSPYFL